MNVKTKILCSGAAAALALCLAAGPSFAQNQQGATPPPIPQQTTTTRGGQNDQNMPGTETPQTNGNNQTMNRSSSAMMTDKQFVQKAAEGNMAEIKLGELAQQNGTNDAVKNMGKRMVDDHTKANDQLKDAASQSNIMMPTTLSKKDQANYDRLSKLTGKAFDKAYARDMVRDHQKDIAVFRSEARHGQDAGIKNFASQTLPTLEQHLKQARQTLRTVAPSTRTGAQ
ncbi:MAG TPA: DUF4142 domain-containing protein [Candidatus Acidoferrales bacterium]|nr:DUF4142 domain-containing protein [Candidatus Acidoferrales bacterium]